MIRRLAAPNSPTDSRKLAEPMTRSSSLPPPPPPPPSAPPPPPSAGHGRPPETQFAPTCRWGLGDAFTSYGVFLLGSLVAGLIAFGAQGDTSRLAGAWLPFVVVLPPLLQIAHVRWVATTRGTGLNRDFGFALKGRDFAIAAGLWLVAIAAATASLWFLDVIGVGTPTAAVAELTEDSEGGRGITIWIIILAVSAATIVPVAEELVFRGLWWSALLKRGMDERLVLVVTAAVFAAAHLEPRRTLVLFAIGLALGWGRMRTGRIAPSIIAHAIINGTGMVALLTSLN